jgi:acyl-CoA thioester hydrolase
MTNDSPTSAPRPLEVTLDIPVRGYDIDFAGVVSNQVYIRWLEDLRYRLLEVHYPLSRLMAEGLAPVLSRTEIDYRRPVRLFDAVQGSMWVASLQGGRWTLQAEFRVNRKQVARARQSGVFVDLVTLHPAPIPAALQQQFDAFPS